jgi:hypothetical protein
MRYCEDCGHHHPLRHSCKKIDCPECFFDSCKRSAKHIEERLQGVGKAYASIGKRLGRLQHLWLTVPKSEYSKASIESLERKLKENLKLLGVTAGVYFIHPWRIKYNYQSKLLNFIKSNNIMGGEWTALHYDPMGFSSPFPYLEEGVHFHVLGYYKETLLTGREFKDLTGWGYFASISNNRNVYTTARYLITHSALIGNKNAYHYFGLASPFYTRVSKEKYKEYVPCPECDSSEYRLIRGIGEADIEAYRNGKWKPKLLSIANGGTDPYVRRVFIKKFFTVPRKFTTDSVSLRPITQLELTI